MKKYLLSVFLVLGLGLSTKAMDPFHIKNHGAEILNDKKWHTLTYEEEKYIGTFIRDIEIRQKDTGVDYEFRSLDNDAVLNFKNWLLYGTWCLLVGDGYGHDENVSTTSTPDIDHYFIGSFRGDNFIQNIDNVSRFVGIDVLK